MVRSRVTKIVLDGYGSFLGMERGQFVLRDRDGKVEKYPLFEREIGEVILKSGNLVSTGALACLGFWDIDVTILTRKGKPVALLRSLDDDSHVVTRLCQYEAYGNGKGVKIAKQLVLSKLEGQNLVLKKYGLKLHVDRAKVMVESVCLDCLEVVRKKLISFEGKFSELYFNQILTLIPDRLRPSSRRKFKAYDGINNVFNLAYEVLSWKVHRAILKAKLEPYLGFLHSIQYSKPSLICDFQELYRYLIDDFLIQFCQNLKVKDFITKYEVVARNKVGKREYLNDVETNNLMVQLTKYFDSNVNIARIKIGYKQSIETLINEEALLFAKYLRNERETWTARLSLIL